MVKASLELTKRSKAAFDQLARSGNVDLRPVFKIMAIGYRKEVKAIFEKKQPRQAGLRWQPLSSAYAKVKARKYPDAPILVRTGTLKDSITKKGSEGNIMLIGKNSATFGTSIRYAKAHDDGNSRNNLPKRNFSEPSVGRTEIWRGQLNRAITQNFAKHGIKVDGDIFI